MPCRVPFIIEPTDGESRSRQANNPPSGLPVF